MIALILDHLFDGYMAARSVGKKTRRELESMAREQFDEVQGQLRFVLAIDASESAAFRPEDMREINGITFLLDPKLAERLSDYCLTFEDGNFLLKGDGYVAHSLREARARKG